MQLVRHPQTKERDTDRLHLNHRATSRLYSQQSTFYRGIIDQSTRHSIERQAAERSIHLYRANTCFQGSPRVCRRMLFYRSTPVRSV